MLAKCGLPVEDVERHIERFMVAKDANGLVGVAGLESTGRCALLRSVAVPEERRGEGIADKLCDALLARAKRNGVSDVYLLTTDAAEYFARLGFEPVSRAAAPREIAATQEFARLCPASAAVMAKKL